MTIQTGVGKTLAYKKESTWGTIAGTTGAKYLRRVTSDIDLSKDTYTSNEIVSNYQISDFRHGSRRVAGSIRGELSPGSYWDFMQTAVRAAGAALTDITSVSVQVAAGSVVNGIQTYTLTRSAGSWYTDGVRIGMVVRITTGLADAKNINKNLLVVSMTSATVIVVFALNGTAMAAEGPTSSTVEAPGKYCYVPESGHTNDSYSIEHYFGDISQSEVFTGCRVSALNINLPPNGMSTCEVAFMGKDVTVDDSEYFQSVGAASTKGVVAAVNGVVLVAGQPQGILTGLTINTEGGMTVGQVVGSVYTPDVFAGRVNTKGQFTAYFDGVTVRDAFLNETEISIVAAFATGNGNTADFISFVMPRVKIGGATKSDGEQGLILTCPYQALYNSDSANTNGREDTTLWIQDSNDAMA